MSSCDEKLVFKTVRGSSLDELYLLNIKKIQSSLISLTLSDITKSKIVRLAINI